LRGRLNVIRQAEAGKAKVTIDRAYHLLQKTLADLQRLRILSYAPEVESLLQSW
jgi:hypothetical protein